MSTGSSSRPAGPEVSFIVPCYNEEAIIEYTIPRLLKAFENGGYRLELVVVDNGSTDRTGEIIRDMAAKNPAIVHYRVEQNEGYGNGVLKALPLCTAPWVGIIPADGQVDAEDVVGLYEAVLTTDGNVLGKVRRRFRMDGFKRAVMSIIYNCLVRALWPRLESLDINGSPKLLPRQIINQMELKSKDWLLDPEIMIKAHYMGVKVLELNAFSRMRSNGVSHVQMGTCWTFLHYLFLFRFSPEWRRKLRQPSLTSKANS